MATITETMGRLIPARSLDVLLPLGVMGILAVMVVPLPPLLLDFSLTLNITFSIIILVVALNVQKPLNFSIFPTVLLVTTLFRLSLNVASTRLILLQGNEGSSAAGRVIEAFGVFVVGGNYAVGIVVFAILVIINFVVITRGAGRIAEVSARFVLDAMPGKQMAIDADLNAGLIAEDEARKRRSEISREADFYGAMDGASKFVRGDAVAGILIVFINIIGGLIIGVLQQGMGVMDALSVYTVLTIGDGLVAQIPALIVSTAAGIIVTRAASESNLTSEMASQMFRNPKAIASAAGVLFVLGLMPGLPHVAFLTLAMGAGAVAYLSHKRGEARTEAEVKAKAALPKPAETPSDMMAPVDQLSMEVGYRLIPLVDSSNAGELLERVKAMRKQIASETGFIVPPIHIKDNLNLKPEEYVFLLKGVDIGRGEVMTSRHLAIAPANATPGLEGIPTKEPAFGLQALWIEEQSRDKAKLMGYTVVNPAIVIVTHLAEVVKSHAHELLTRQDVQGMLETLSKNHPKVVEELVPGLLSTGAVQKVLNNLLRERVSIRDMLTIIETLADNAPHTKDAEHLTEHVRRSLSRTITRQYSSEDQTLPVMIMDPRLEDRLMKALHGGHETGLYSLEPATMQKLMGSISAGAEDMASKGHTPLLMTSPEMRRIMRKSVERVLPTLSVISTAEISGNVKIKNTKVVSL